MKAFRELHRERTELLRARGLSLPANRPGGRHLLDRYMVDQYCADAETLTGRGYDTVRACFPEGEPIFPGSAILSQTHLQIAVRHATCILRVHRVL